MTTLIRQVLAHQYPYVSASGVAAVLFFGVFVAMLIWAFRTETHDYITEMEKLPLDGADS